MICYLGCVSLILYIVSGLMLNRARGSLFVFLVSGGGEEAQRIRRLEKKPFYQGFLPTCFE